MLYRDAFWSSLDTSEEFSASRRAGSVGRAFLRVQVVLLARQRKIRDTSSWRQQETRSSSTVYFWYSSSQKRKTDSSYVKLLIVLMELNCRWYCIGGFHNLPKIKGLMQHPPRFPSSSSSHPPLIWSVQHFPGELSLSLIHVQITSSFPKIFDWIHTEPKAKSLRTIYSNYANHSSPTFSACTVLQSYYVFCTLLCQLSNGPGSFLCVQPAYNTLYVKRQVKKRLGLHLYSCWLFQRSLLHHTNWHSHEPNHAERFQWTEIPNDTKDTRSVRLKHVSVPT